MGKEQQNLNHEIPSSANHITWRFHDVNQQVERSPLTPSSLGFFSESGLNSQTHVFAEEHQTKVQVVKKHY